MDIEKLATFAEVARQGSVTRAAQRLGLQQPTVSHRLTALEREVGVALFERLSGSLTLTAAGAALLPHALQLPLAAAEAREAARRAAGLAAQRLHIGCAETPATYLLPEWLRALRGRNPRLDVRLTVGNAARVLAVAISGEVDLALLTDRDSHPHLYGETVVRDRFVVVTAADDRWAGRTQVTIADLVTRRLLLRESGAGTRAFVDSAVRAAGEETDDTLEVASLEALKRMAEAGVGVAVVPRIAVQREVAERRLHLLELQAEGNSLSYSLLRHKDKPLVPGAVLFRRVLGLASPPSLPVV